MSTKNTVESMVERLRADPGPMREVAEESGLGMEWLYAFRDGRIADPGVLKIEALKDTLRRRARRQSRR